MSDGRLGLERCDELARCGGLPKSGRMGGRRLLEWKRDDSGQYARLTLLLRGASVLWETPPSLSIIIESVISCSRVSSHCAGAASQT